MIFWGAFWGLLIGAFISSMGYGMFMGMFLGAGVGWSLQVWLNAQLRQQLGLLREEFNTALELERRSAEKSLSRLQADPEPSTEPLPAAAPAQMPVYASAAEPPASAQAAPAAPRALDLPGPVKRPAPLEVLLQQGLQWLMGGNTIVRVGLVVLFVGLSFLARYAAVSGFFPIELRMALVTVVGLVLMLIGFVKRLQKPAYALAMQGGGVAVMYLSVFASYRLYELLSAPVAFALLVLVCVCACALALLQNAFVLAFAAFAGGFAAPVLASSGQGNHLGLFSYYALLNLAILFIVLRRSWRWLSVLGFVATLGVASAWGVLHYNPEHYATTQPFLVLFVLIYVAGVVLQARSAPSQGSQPISSGLLFGTPLLGFALQMALVRSWEMGAAYSALGFGLFYLTLAAALGRQPTQSFQLLRDGCIAIGVGFATMAIPLGLDAQWTVALWSLEGAGAFWVGMRQARWLPRAFGLLLQGVAAFLHIALLMGGKPATTPLLNAPFLGGLLLALPLLTLSWWLRKPLPHNNSRWAMGYAKFETRLCTPLFVAGFAFWCLAWMGEISHDHLWAVWGLEPSRSAKQWMMVLSFLFSAAGTQVWGMRKQWAAATLPSRWSLLVLWGLFVVQWHSGLRVLQSPAVLAWPVALLLHYTMLRQLDRWAVQRGQVSPAMPQVWMHAGGVWLLTVLQADALWQGIEAAQLINTAWARVVMLASAVIVFLVLALWAGRARQSQRRLQSAWPLNPHAYSYLWVAALPVAVLLFVGALVVAISSSGITDPLPYIPLLNPTDLTVGLAIAALWVWGRMVQSAEPALAQAQWVAEPRARMLMGGLCFVALNSVWLRIAHHHFAVDWKAKALFESFVVQTGYAILWTLLALTLMVSSHRRQLRVLWQVGAGLQGVVVVKLVLIDLSNAGGIERIVAFMAVGILMLVVGYFAPMPPKPAGAEALPSQGAPT